MAYQAPVEDIIHALKSVAGIEDLIAEGTFDDLDMDTVRAILEEAGRFGSEVLEPLNQVGDQQGTRLEGGKVITPDGWSDAYQQFAQGGWSALPCPTEFGGQGLPSVVSTAVCEIWNASNLAFGVGPLLTQGAIDAIEIGGSDDLKATYLPSLISGKWSGTMNLTEPQAGSDVGALTSKAIPQGDGTYLISGTKIFISYGEHEMTENIIHLVLARLPDAPKGTRGISLVLVPKFLVNKDGSLGERNDVACTGVEKKLGIHGSPTCVMTYGEKDGAIGYLIGEENRGLKTMFVMMNAARLAVGMQGVALAERATQRAIAYAYERRQGADLAKPEGGMCAIVQHPDIRRTLMEMRALTQACRMICLKTARELDLSHNAKDQTTREAAGAMGALLTPIAKVFSTDIGCEVASMGIQIHGGMGFVEETGAAQHLRDARILPIYEGTNGIQAIDLVTRKLPLAGGEIMKAHLQDLAQTIKAVAASPNKKFGQTGTRLGEALTALTDASVSISDALRSNNPAAALAVATPYLRIFGLATGGVYLAKAALAALDDNTSDGDGVAADKVALARFFAEVLSTAAPGLALTVTSGADAVLEAPFDAA